VRERERERERESTGASAANQRNVELLTADFLVAASGRVTAAGVRSSPDAVELLWKTPADLARLLDERAARAQHVDEHVHQHAAGDAALLTQAPAHHRAEVEAEKRQQAVQEAVLADALGVLSHRVARTKVRQEAQFHVGETAEQTELPVRAARLARRRHRRLATLCSATADRL